MRIFDRLLLITATLVLAISPLSRVVACDLQPANKNPADVPGIEMTRLARLVNATFTAGSGSQRYYDHVEQLDGITIAFGHWPQQEVEGLFKDMKLRGNGKAFVAFTGCLTEFFARRENANAWRRAQQVARVASADPTGEHMAAVLNNTLLSATFMKRYRTHCNEKCRPGEPNMYHEHEDWLVPALRFALRDRDVINWQVDFWSRTIVDDAAKMAVEVGLKDDEAAIVAAAAYRSSSPAWFKPVTKAAQTGQLSLNHQQWNWNALPGGAKQDAEGLKEWRRFILWQYYAARVWVIHHRVRARSIKFYTEYLADRWLLPALGPDGKPNWKNADNLNPALVKPKQ